MGMRHALSPVTLDAASNSAAKLSSAVQTPQICFPSEIMHAPVSVDNSRIESHPISSSTYTRASAKVSRPSASVLITSIVLPFEAVKISLATNAFGPIIFSHAATTKWTSTPLGPNAAIACAAPKTAAAPPQSNFINSIMEVLMLYPPVSNSNPFPTMPTFLCTWPSLGR